MPEPARPASVVADFEGLITNTDPRDLPEGASENQINLVCVEVGELRTRLGIKPVSFEP
jgi:hypothetical protein